MACWATSAAAHGSSASRAQARGQTPMPHAEGRSHEIDDGAGLGIDRWRSVLLGPPVVVLADRMENRVPPRPAGKRHAVLHDPAREVRVIGLGDQLETIVDDANDHRAATVESSPRPGAYLSRPAERPWEPRR